MSQMDRTCRLCKCPLKFAVNIEGGRTLPIDARARVYVVIRDEDGDELAWDLQTLLANAGELVLVTADGRKKVEVVAAGVSHYATCPQASSFSGRK